VVIKDINLLFILKEGIDSLLVDLGGACYPNEKGGAHMRRGLWLIRISFLLALILLCSCTPYMAGNFQLSRKNYEEAIIHYREAVSQNHDNWKARGKLGFAYLKTGQLEKAVNELTKVLEQEPGDPHATLYLGLAYLNMGEVSQTIVTWKNYTNKSKPLVEEEIERQLTLLEIAESMRLAREALAKEEELKAKDLEPGTLAVFYFKDTSAEGKYRHLQKALAMMLITDLSQIESLQVVERLRMQFLLDEMGLGQTGLVDKETAPRAGKLLGAESLVVGTLGSGSLSVKSTIASSSRQDVMGAFRVTSEEEEFYILEKEIVFSILKILNVSLTPEEKEQVSKYHTKSLKAVIYFGMGLEALDQGNWKEAKNFFIKAREEDPEFLLAGAAASACPDASAPSISALSAMSAANLAGVMDGVVEAAAASQEAADTEAAAEAETGGGGEQESTTSSETETGSVGVSW
jgi:tetratricopeptide (TPR) repeat protein